MEGAAHGVAVGVGKTSVDRSGWSTADQVGCRGLDHPPCAAQPMGPRSGGAVTHFAKRPARPLPSHRFRANACHRYPAFARNG
jgi:hypothetical protein